MRPQPIQPDPPENQRTWLINDDALFADNPPRLVLPQRQPLPPAQRRRRRLIALGVCVGVVAICLLAVWLFVPGLRRPVDLGIRPTRSDYQAAVTLLQYQAAEAPQQGQPQDYTCTYGAPQAVDLALTSQQLTALFSCNRPAWEPIEDLQIRLEEDGTATLSARVPKQWIVTELLAGLYSQADLEYVLPGFLPQKMHLMVQVGGRVEGNRTRLTLHKASVMGLGIPDSMLQSPEASQIIAEVLDHYLAQLASRCGLDITLAYVSGGRLALTAMIPSGQTWLPAAGANP